MASLTCDALYIKKTICVADYRIYVAKQNEPFSIKPLRESRGGLKIEKITFFAETEWAHLDPSPLKDRSISDPKIHGGVFQKKAFSLK